MSRAVLAATPALDRACSAARAIRNEVSRAGQVAAGSVRGNPHHPWVLCQAMLSINRELALLRQMLRLAARHCKAPRVPMLEVLYARRPAPASSRPIAVR